MILHHAPAGTGLASTPNTSRPGRICRATYDRVPESHRYTTHTCDLPVDHARAHHCPICKVHWDRPATKEPRRR